MKRDGFADDLVSEIGAERPRCPQVDGSAEERRQLLLHPDEFEVPGRAIGFEFDENVDVAFAPEVRTKHGSEEGKPANVVALAEPADFGASRFRRSDSSVSVRDAHPLILSPEERRPMVLPGAGVRGRPA